MSDGPVPVRSPGSPAPEPQLLARPSRGPFWIGCGIGCLVLLALVVGATLVGGRILQQRYADWKASREVAGEDFVARGYRRVSGTVLQVSERVTQPTVFVGEIVSLTADADADVAIVALSAEVRGKVAGTLYFRGELLAIYPGAVIAKDLDVRANYIHLLGEVKGKVLGTYVTMNKTPLKLGLPDRPKDQRP